VVEPSPDCRRDHRCAPPGRDGNLSSADAPFVADLFAGAIVDARTVSENLGAASAPKMAFAAWTKHTSALLLAVRAVARGEGVEETPSKVKPRDLLDQLPAYQQGVGLDFRHRMSYL
jgi:hypothetical protein